MPMLRFAAYCGMSHTVAEGEPDELRAIVARRILRARRRDQPVAIIERGREWEFETPEDAIMVSDIDGILSIVEDEDEEEDEVDLEDDEPASSWGAPSGFCPSCLEQFDEEGFCPCLEVLR